MLFKTPALQPDERWVLGEVDDLRLRLGARMRESPRWVGLLRRVSLARAIQGSNSIEGYNASIDDALAAVDREDPIDASDETWAAITGYREAMSYVLQLADDIHFVLDTSLIRSLHYMMLSYDASKSPGRWRLGPIFVRREETGEIVYTGPDAALVPPAMTELVDRMRDEEGPAIVRAAMAHLNLVMIHPFRDGNGRMARCLQTLVLARQQVLAPDFCSIEEYLGRNTPAYYNVLADVGGGRWQPDRDTRPWLRFCLTAHFRQGRALLRRVERSERRWNAIEELVQAEALPERSIAALFNAAQGYRLRNATYRVLAEGVTELMASRDLRALVKAGLLDPRGERRGRFYLASPGLRELEASLRTEDQIDSVDPFELAHDALAAQTVPIWPSAFDGVGDRS
jgi:Fic family protein